MSEGSEIEPVAKIILDWAIKENQLIQWRSHAGSEYLFGFPDFAASEGRRKLSLEALQSLVDKELVCLKFEFNSNEVNIKLYDLTDKLFSTTKIDAEVKNQVLTLGNSIRIIKHSTSLPPYIELDRAYNATTEERILFLSAIEKLELEGRIRVSSSSDGDVIYGLV